MNVSRPYHTVCSNLSGELLVVLAGTTRPLTGREVAKLVKGGSQTGVNRALHRLVEHGIVNAQEAGKAILYTLNRKHIAAQAVEKLAGMREELLRRLRNSLSKWKIAPHHASLFGSTARADGDIFSDIDIFLVRPGNVDEENPQWRSQVERWVRDIRAWTGNNVGLSEIPEKQIRQLKP
jgi:DNA-binding transcriptional ArsR family regulator